MAEAHPQPSFVAEDEVSDEILWMDNVEIEVSGDSESSHLEDFDDPGLVTGHYMSENSKTQKIHEDHVFEELNTFEGEQLKSTF